MGGEGVDAMVNNATVRIHPGGWVVYSTSQVNVVGFIVQVMLCICVSLDAELDCNGELMFARARVPCYRRFNKDRR